MALSGTDPVTLDAIRVVVGLVAMGLASVYDLRTRRVPNGLWYATAVVGACLLVLDLSRVEGPLGWNLLLAFPVVAVFAVVVTGGELWPVMPPEEEDQDRELTPREARVYVTDLVASALLLVASAVVLAIAPGRLGDGSEHYWYVVSAVLMILVALGLYVARFLHGGGDAKALMTLAVLFPVHPLGGTFPLLEVPEGMDILFPFALAVLINAAIITALAPLAFVAISASRRPLRFPEALFGYPVPVGALDPTRVWLLYEAEKGAGEVTRRLWPRRSRAAEEARERALQVLVGRGDERVYVSPKIPFMVPMFLGLVIAVLLGNLVTGLIWAIAGL